MICVTDRAPSQARRAVIIFLAQPSLQVVRQLFYQVATGNAGGPVRRADMNDPGKRARNNAKLGHTGECCGFLSAIRPRAMGGIRGTVAVRGRE